MQAGEDTGKNNDDISRHQGGAGGQVGGVAWAELSRLCRGSPLNRFTCVRLYWGLLESETFETFVSSASKDPLNYADKIRWGCAQRFLLELHSNCPFTYLHLISFDHQHRLVIFCDLLLES